MRAAAQMGLRTLQSKVTTVCSHNRLCVMYVTVLDVIEASQEANHPMRSAVSTIQKFHQKFPPKLGLL